MNSNDIAKIRLQNQQISCQKFTKPKEIVKWMGAMQAQDYNMAKWAVGIRLPQSPDELIDSAISKGDIIRTHLLRPTWHFISNDNMRMMLEFIIPRTNRQLKSKNLTAFINKCSAVLEKILSLNHLTGGEILTELKRNNINPRQRISSFLNTFERTGLLCSGKIKNGKHTYALVEERIPKRKNLTRDDFLAALAKIYFTSRCPATIDDFVWFSGLPLNEARRALEMIKSGFIVEKINDKTYLFNNNFTPPNPGLHASFLLPAFDEFLISYKDRSESITYKNRQKAISTNGIFRPIIVIDGIVEGIWKRSIKKDKLILETKFFGTSKQKPVEQVKASAEKLCRFYGLKEFEVKGV
jgi:hypothetical protein